MAIAWWNGWITLTTIRLWMQVQNLQRRLGALEQECAAREQEAERQRREFEATATAREWQLQALQERLKVRLPLI